MGLLEEEMHGSWTLTVASYLFEISHCCRLEVNVAQDEAALCTKLEGLYYAYGNDGRRPRPGKICERVVEISGHCELDEHEAVSESDVCGAPLSYGTVSL